MSELHDKLYAALKDEPQPLTLPRVLEIAQQVLPATEYGQFVKWSKVNGDALLAMLNG